MRDENQPPTGTSTDYVRPPDAQPVKSTDLDAYRPSIGNTGGAHLSPDSPAVAFPTSEELRSLSAQKSPDATQVTPEEITALNTTPEIPPIPPESTHTAAMPSEQSIDPTIKPFDPTTAEAPKDDYEEILPNGRVAGIRELLGRVPQAVKTIDNEIADIQAFLNDPRLKKAEGMGLIQIMPSTNENVSQAALSLIAEKLADINAGMDSTTADLLPQIDAAVANASSQVAQSPTSPSQIDPAPQTKKV